MSARSKKKTKPGAAPLNESMQECLEILKFLQVKKNNSLYKNIYKQILF